MNDHYISASGRRFLPYPSAPPETIVLVGTGAIENSWRPVTRALQKIYPHLPEEGFNVAGAASEVGPKLFYYEE